jgi:hypothetical protein
MSTYPLDLIPILKSKWKQRENRRYGKVSSLPSTSELEILLDVAFHATLLTEEGRRPGFRLLHYPSKDYEEDQKAPFKDPFYTARLLPLDVPRPYTIAELNRLAPAAELTRMLICIDNISNDPQKPDLRIWAILDAGGNWWKFVRSETGSGYPPPPHLTISSSCPGELSFSAQGEVVLTLRNGRILYPISDVLETGPIAEFFKAAKTHLYSDTLASLGRTDFDGQGHDEDYPLRSYSFFLERMLFDIREKQHGGMVIIIPKSIDKTDTRIADRLNIKYSCSYDYIWALLVRSLVNHRKFYDSYHPLWEGKRAQTAEKFQEYVRLSTEQQELDEALGDAAQAVATLTSVDGAVVMTDRLNILGFGAEVTAISHLQEIVISAEPTHLRTPLESYGTRHRAAFRFCSSFEDSVVFVVSRDGGVRAVKRVGSDVILWPDINAGAMGL